MSAAVRPPRGRSLGTDPQINTVSLDGRGLQELLTRASAAAFASRPNGRIALWNRAAEQMLGWSAKETLGRFCATVFATENGKVTKGPDRPARRITDLARLGEPVQHLELKTRTKSGQLIWLDITILEAASTNGGRPITIHLLRDVTAAKALLEVVQQRSWPPAPSSALSARELEVLALMAAGANTRTMTERLHVSTATIRNHAQNILAKLGVHSRLEAVAWANQRRS